MKKTFQTACRTFRSPTGAEGNTNNYGYDRTGNLTQSTDPRTGTTQFEYDKLGRITRAGDELFAFDPAHNIVDIPARPSENMPEGIDEKVYIYSCLNGKLSPDILSIEEFDSLISSWLIKNKNGIKK
ncbi:RHS repeat domain-containing protein [Neisseria sp. oral taxon 014]|uniref:RHS repeat domain-containing protein n=1 Tax=Neisseria sp. oral taxon 014 TaxID=641148 RepID=UPI000A0302C4|nr:RHS repeat domain-containing protein [Neisseria sp. oral taxon 014]